MVRRRKKSIVGLIADVIIMVFKGLWHMLKILLPIILTLLASIFYVVVALVYFLWSVWGYSKSDYKEITHNSLWDVFKDKGKRGEYLIYRHLRDKKSNTKWLFNVYIPRDDGRTTEIDVLMIHKSGVYVFESKNYSGWIYGSSDREQWTQCIKPSEDVRTKKYKFFNPIMQNDIHIKYLKPLLDPEIQKSIYPVVVFGDRCVLKNIKLDNNYQMVIRRQDVKRVFRSQFMNSVIDKKTINQIFDSLYHYTQVSNQIKEKHIQDINEVKFN